MENPAINSKTPPPPRRPYHVRRRISIVLAFMIVALLLAMRLSRLVSAFSMPSGSMSPTISLGDRIMMENISFLCRKPRRGDVVLFKTDGVPAAAQGEIYVKRVAGLPGDRLRIANGKLYINGSQLVLSNAGGGINYSNPPMSGSIGVETETVVPADSYFVIGDNSVNSADSRLWGGVPGKNIIGRAWFCYWPPQKSGSIK